MRVFSKCLDCGSNKLNLRMPHGIFQSHIRPFTFVPFFLNNFKIQIRVRWFVCLFCHLLVKRHFYSHSNHVWIYFWTIFQLRLRPFKMKSPSTHVLFHRNRNSTIWLNFISSKNSVGNAKGCYSIKALGRG